MRREAYFREADDEGYQVRLGIEAPKSVAVHREEVYARIRRERAGGDDASKPPAHRLRA